MSPPPHLRRSTGFLVVAGPIACADVPRLCERLRDALAATSDAEVIVCDIGALAPDGASVDALARLQLTARRLGREIRLQRASRELQQLLAFVGLADVVVAVGPALGLGHERQCEEREQPRRVEERVDRDDAVASDLDDL